MRKKLKMHEFETILDSIADGVFTVDNEWTILSWNRAAEKITGFSQEEAIGQSCHDVFQTNVCQSSCVLRQTLESGENLINVPINIITKDGYEKPVSISTAVLRDTDGKVIGGAETFRDLSDIETLRKRLHQEYTFEDIISKNHKIKQIFHILPDIAESESTVIVQGPSGSGKELFARAIHNLSPRKGGPFVAVNCAALPDTLLESELFGYKAGAFTDAKRDKPGRFHLAQGGTLFLDEIGDISAALQVKLLRVLQEKTYEPLGSNQAQKADTRIIAATNKDLKEEMARGRFRDDLYYRLNVIQIEIPPLKERKEDIPLLIDHFIERFNAEKGCFIQGITPAAISALMLFEYPGNVRQLENAIEHAFVLTKGPLIDLNALPLDIIPEQEKTDQSELPESGNPLMEAEKRVIEQALSQHNGHREKTAKALKMHKTTLLRKMKKLGITYP